MVQFRAGADVRPEALFAGRYAVDGLLPWGGLVRYYRASAENSALILSVLPMDVSRSASAEAAFSELAQRMGSIRCASVPTVVDAGIIGGVPYLAFNDTRGTLLTDVLRDRPLGSVDVLRLAGNVLDGLEAAHRAGLVHGDLTPQNVVIARDRRGRLSARLIGIGMLPLLREHPEASAHAVHTGSGKFAVTYMAPELFGGGEIGHSVDLYAAGALIHHMVTGAPPRGPGREEGFEDIPELPEVIERARARRPVDRYASAAAMHAALEWLEVESSKRNPQTQDIAPWMETSQVGSVPVAVLSSMHPPAHLSSHHPPGKILRSAAPHPRPAAPMIPERADSQPERRWLQLALLLLLLGALVSLGFWQKAYRDGAPSLESQLHLETVDGR